MLKNLTLVNGAGEGEVVTVSQPDSEKVGKECHRNVYYWRTWYKAVCGGKGGSEGHVLRDTTSRGLRGRV